MNDDGIDVGADPDGGDGETGADPDDSPGRPGAVPDWDDGYLDRVADRLMYSYDLGKDVEVAGAPVPLYGRLVVRNQKHLFHPSVRYGYHEAVEHLFVERIDHPRPVDLRRLRERGETLAESWIEPDEDHFETAFTFVVVAESLPSSVRSFVADHDERTLLRWGLNGHYEVRFVVVAPQAETAVSTPSADVAAAFRLWDDGKEESDDGGLLARLFG